MAPAALAILYATEADIQGLLSIDGETGRVDDDADGSVSPVEEGYVQSALNYATATVNRFLIAKYSPQDLATDWCVCEWCVVLACHWLSCRRGNPPPGSTKDLYEAVMKDLQSVKDGESHLDLGMRMSAFPAWSNVRVDQFNTLRKLVVERPISEGTTGATQPATTRDLTADWIFDPGQG